MTRLSTVIVLAAYVSLAIEIVLLPVRSVASSRNLWFSDPALVEVYSARYQRLFELSRLVKATLFVVPLLAVFGVFTYPLIVLWLGPNLLGDYLFVPVSSTDILGAVLVVSGRALAMHAVLTIRQRNKQMGESFFLHTSGPFRWSRNPGLVGMYLFVAGVWMMVPSATMLAGIALYVVYMDFKVRMEEDFLTNKFGPRYVDYRLRVGRYFP